MLLALVLAASGVSLFSSDDLVLKPRPMLKAHLVEVDDELDSLKQSLSQTSGRAREEAGRLSAAGGERPRHNSTLRQRDGDS